MRSRLHPQVRAVSNQVIRIGLGNAVSEAIAADLISRALNQRVADGFRVCGVRVELVGVCPGVFVFVGLLRGVVSRTNQAAFRQRFPRRLSAEDASYELAEALDH